MKKEVSIWWLVIIGLAFDIFGRVSGSTAGALVGLFGDILIIIGLVGGIGKLLRNRKTKKDCLSPVLPQETGVVQKTTDAPKTSQKRSQKLSESKLWRFTQVLYWLIAPFALLAVMAGVTMPQCTTSFGTSKEVCTRISGGVTWGVFLVTVAGIALLYVGFKWAVGYIAYGNKESNDLNY